MLDLSVYLVADPSATRDRALLDVVHAAVRGGATAVQLRDKHASARALAESARALVALLRPLGPAPILGVSATTAAEARAIDPTLADYVGAGPVFPTGSKDDADPPTGLDGLAAIRAATALPVVAIGGITVANAAEVVRAG